MTRPFSRAFQKGAAAVGLAIVLVGCTEPLNRSNPARPSIPEAADTTAVRTAQTTAGLAIGQVSSGGAVGATLLVTNGTTATTHRPTPTAVGATAPAPSIPAPLTAASKLPSATATSQVVSAERQLLNVGWLMISVERRGAKPLDVTGYQPVVVELTASFLAYDTDCGGTLNTYSTASRTVTIGVVVRGDVHGCVEGIPKGPGPETAEAMFTPGTVIGYHIDGEILTLQTPLLTVALRRNRPIHLGSYYPELTRTPGTSSSTTPR